jgi:hypothetical protein
MSKLTIDINKKQNKTVELESPFGKIIIEQTLSLTERTLLKDTFLAYFLNEDDETGLPEFNYIMANFMMKSKLVETKTNIEIPEDIDKMIDVVDEIVSSGMFNDIVSKILNYEDFLSELNVEIENSLKVIQMKSSPSTLVKKGIDLLNKLSSLSDEDALEWKKKVEEILLELKDNETVKNLFSDINRGKDNNV